MRLLATAAILAATLTAGAANAATILIDFNDGTAPGFTGDFGLFPVGVSGIAAAPNSTPFLAVPSQQSAGGTATYTAGGAITAFSFDWGTPDSYNTVSFFSGTTLVSSVTGSGGAFTYNTTFAASQGVTSVAFSSTDRAFEIDNVSVTAVPEPATWALLIAGFAMVGVAARRRVRSLAA